MSIEFINKCCNKKSLSIARRQESQLSYFTQSKIQESYLPLEQIKQWAEKDYQTNDYFLNYVKSILVSENFQFFAKYLRFPLPSSNLIKNIIEPQLNRVFVSDNSFFNYKGKEFDKHELNNNQFETELFERYLYKHNSIVIVDVSDNKAVRYFVDIENVISIEHDNKQITAISFKGCVNGIDANIYIDSLIYSAYTKSDTLISASTHNLGYCPAYFIAPQMADDFIIRRSIFSYVREDLENFVFLSTLLKMTDSNGVIPIVSTLDVKVEGENEQGNPNPGQPNSEYAFGSQTPDVYSTNPKKTAESTGILQAGSVNKIPVIRTDNGSVDMEMVKYFINFHYLPVENLKYLKERIAEFKSNIISTIIGDVVSSSESAKNELQVQKSVIVLENTLISIADDFNHVRFHTDKAMLDLMYGLDTIEPEIFYGTSFFLESESELMAQFTQAPNPLERRNIISTLNRNRYKNNHELRERGVLLYKLIPFVSDVDFNNAVSRNLIDEVTTKLYLQFDYWINRFESEYGDIVDFYHGESENKTESITVILNILTNIISKENGNTGKDSSANNQISN